MKNALLNNLNWFEHSGVMLPADGLWGVAERVALTQGNEAIDTMKAAFQAWTDHDGYCIIEQRRADCNFEAAFMFLLASKALNDPKYADIARNILDFLYFRSGLLEREGTDFIKGSWNWSHIKRTSCIYFDDNSWCIFIPLEIARLFPELDERYQLRTWALLLADELLIAAKRVFTERHQSDDGHWYDAAGLWEGRLDQPHFGSLPCMALARAWSENHKQDYLDFIDAYHAYVRETAPRLNASELCYAIIGAAQTSKATGRPQDLELATQLGKQLVARMDANGNLPAEHNEAPTGPHLVDTIYTANWALVALRMLSEIAPDFRQYFKRALTLLLNIQDKSQEPQFHGCWRGMFDLNAQTWGGGDKFEGGAGSIYTGWTNAPISTVLALELL